jgi:hypothetical protein
MEKLKVIKNQNKALNVINERNEIFSVDVKEHTDPDFLNDVIRFPPIFMNIGIKVNKETIGETVYE